MDKVQNVRRATQCAPLPAFRHKTDNRVRLSAFDPVSEADVDKHIQQIPDKQSWLDQVTDVTAEHRHARRVPSHRG